MSKFDQLDLDGRALRLFLTVYEEGSVTRAADRIGITQSAVSHGLDKLRAIVGDPLFVREGRGITCTAKAEELVDRARELLRALNAFGRVRDFNPGLARGEFTFAANDYQRELLLPPVIRNIQQTAPAIDLKLIASGFEDADILRRERCDISITPDPPDGTEFVQQKLFADHMVCFYDAESGEAPDTLESYLHRPHAKVVFSQNERSRLDEQLRERGLRRRVGLRVASFSALPALMKATDYVAVLPARMRQTLMRDFRICPCPVDLPELAFYMIWHRRNQDSPLNLWVRGLVHDAARNMKVSGSGETPNSLNG